MKKDHLKQKVDKGKKGKGKGEKGKGKDKGKGKKGKGKGEVASPSKPRSRPSEPPIPPPAPAAGLGSTSRNVMAGMGGSPTKPKLDLPGSGFRNTVLRTKQVIIGCGGGFHQECTQPYSPVARWMSEVDVAFNDEGQYGNLDESSAIARVPRKGLVVWCGDHKQTPGGLRKSYEARAFRRKLMRRPIALRGDTKFIPPHMLGAIVHPYVQDVPGLQVAGLRQLLNESTRQPLGLSTGSVAVFQELSRNQCYG